MSCFCNLENSKISLQYLPSHLFSHNRAVVMYSLIKTFMKACACSNLIESNRKYVTFRLLSRI
nr:MAG TPA: hypothetical protein [Caudoviricetes sp.]